MAVVVGAVASLTEHAVNRQGNETKDDEGVDQVVLHCDPPRLERLLRLKIQQNLVTYYLASGLMTGIRSGIAELPCTTRHMKSGLGSGSFTQNYHSVSEHRLLCCDCVIFVCR